MIAARGACINVEKMATAPVVVVRRRARQNALKVMIVRVS
jgi:hypothetical protein